MTALRVATFNLHGTHDGAPGRLRRIGEGLAALRPDVVAFQEVLRDGDLLDTGRDIAAWMSWLRGRTYSSEFAHCHAFMERYPEGVGLSSCLALEGRRVVDLTSLENGLRPVMARNALVADVHVDGRRVVVACVHLDHAADAGVRLAQARKLVRDLGGAPRVVMAGDFNDTAESPALAWLSAEGFRDAWRADHDDDGATFPCGAPERRIDHVLVRGDLDVVSSEIVLADPSLSDHVGLVVEVR